MEFKLRAIARVEADLDDFVYVPGHQSIYYQIVTDLWGPCTYWRNTKEIQCIH